jgi:hypothetical protein
MMKMNRQILGARLRAAGVLVALLGGWLSVPVTLASSPSNLCSMICCVEDGRCCCYPEKSFVKGQYGDGRDHIDRAAILTECPAGCSPPQFSIYSFIQTFDRKGAYRLELKRPPPVHSYSDFHILDILESHSSSPRSPPEYFV